MTLPVRTGLHCTGSTGLFSRSEPQDAKAADDQHNDYRRHSDGSTHESRALITDRYTPDCSKIYIKHSPANRLANGTLACHLLKELPLGHSFKRKI